MTLALPADVPILDGWNVWDVLQSQAPIDPLPGTLDQQLGAWVREVLGDPDMPLALVSPAAAGELAASRAVIPELAGTPALGVGGSAIARRTVAFESKGGRSIPWPHDDNLMLDAVYHAAPAPRAGNTAVATAPRAGNTQGPRPVEQASLMPFALLLVLSLGGFALARRRS